jgi:hypothetical protein
MQAPYFPTYANDTLAEISWMTNEEAGAWLRLKCQAWEQEPKGTLPDNDTMLMRLAQVPPSKWQEIKETVMYGFALGEDGRWHNAKLEAVAPKNLRRNDYPESKRLLMGDWYKIRLVVLERDSRICAYCGSPAATVDHRNPRSRGGDNQLENLSAACRSCNSSKKDQTAEEFQSKREAR